MNHKDLLNSVVANMASTTSEETIEVPMEEEETNINPDEMIKLTISTGEQFLIDPNTFDWDTAITKIPEMETNHEAMMKMMKFILNIKDFNNNDAVSEKETLHDIIGQLEKYLKGFEIIPGYYLFDNEIDKDRMDKLVKKAMLLIFDTFAVSQTMYRNISLFSAMKLIAGKPYDTGHPISSDDIDEMLYGSNDDTPTMFKVVIKGTEIVSIVEDDNCAPDEIGMILPGDTDDEDVIFVNAKTIFEAHAFAEKLIKEINETGGTING